MASSASRRSLGGGRVLGSGKNLSPAAAAAVSSSSSPSPQQQQRQQHKRHSSWLSPSESSLSLNSQTSNSPASTSVAGGDAQDLLSRVSLDHADNTTAATASSRLVCPICNEEMMTLLQLNRHLDDAHKNLEEVEQDEVKTWFKTQMVKAKRFQPLAVLNQKLKGLDVFESNDLAPTPPVAISDRASPEPTRPDPDEVVTRAHWQRPGPYDTCSDPTCGTRLGSTNGNVNCRKCGKLFCDEHTMYQIKLSRSAQHEPVRGVWCRVCETCYKSREGYNDHSGFERNHTDGFTSIRRKTVDKAYLEISRLEKRLTKLTQLLSNPPADQQSPGGGLLWPLSNAKAQQRALEQSVIAWEEDAGVVKCPFCQQEFSNYSFRRHHCRLCGRVVCGDLRTGCSTEIGLNVAVPSGHSEKQMGQASVDVRMCKDCKHTLFSKSDFLHEVNFKPPDQRSYENLVQFERGIRLLTPKFQKLLVALQHPENPPTPDQLAEATRVRKRLMDTFTKYDSAARRIRDLPTTSHTQAHLQKAIYQKAYNFLNLHMLPLKSLPKVLKHAAPHGGPTNSTLNSPKPPASPNGRPTTPRALAGIQYDDSGGASGAASSTASAVSTLEAEEKELRDRLIVLEEQRFFVQEMIASANRHRRFDEVAALAGNVEELSKEIDGINGQLGQLNFAAAYAQDRAA